VLYNPNYFSLSPEHLVALSADKSKQLVDYWTRGSTEDLLGAKEIITKTSRYASGLFFLHLAIEKALKALFCKKMSEHAPYTHNLLGLIEKLGLAVSEDDLKILAEINEFNLEARYPDEKFSLLERATKDLSTRYLHEAERLQSWIFKILNS
jgi:HEPN domain-containing protein